MMVHQVLLLWSGIRGLGIPTTGNNIIKGVNMKTIKTLFASLSFLFLGLVPISAMGQSLPHTFSANTAAKASEVNENFKYLLERFGTRKTAVNCYSGESIANALKNYNHLVITGICNENIVLDASESNQPYVILEGSESNMATILQASNNSKDLIHIVNGATTLVVRNLTLKGGYNGIRTFPSGGMVIVSNAKIMNQVRHGVEANGGTQLIMSNVELSNYGSVSSSETWWIPRGVLVNNNSHARLENLTLNSPNTKARDGIVISGSSSAEISGVEVKNHECGIRVWGSHLDLHNVANSGLDQYEPKVGRSSTLSKNQNGLCIEGGSHAWIVNIDIYENTNHGLLVGYNSSVDVSGSTIRNNASNGIHIRDGGQVNLFGGNKIYANGDNGIRLGDGSQLDVPSQSSSPTVFFTQTNGSDANTNDAIRLQGRNAILTIADSSLDLSYHRYGIYVGRGGAIKVENITIKKSTQDGVYLEGAQMEMNNSTISENSEDGVDAYGSGISISNSTISLNKSNGVNVRQTSRVNIDNVIVSGNEKNGIQIKRNTYIQVSDSNIESNKANGISVSRNSYLDLNRSSIKNNTQDGVNVYHNSSLDFGGESSDTATVIELNGGDGVDVYKKVIVEFDGAPVTIKNNTGNQFKFGAGSEAYIPASTLTVNRIDCWYRTTKDPNNNSVTHSSGYPIIGFENISAFAGTISSNCRVD